MAEGGFRGDVAVVGGGGGGAWGENFILVFVIVGSSDVGRVREKIRGGGVGCIPVIAVE